MAVDWSGRAHGAERHLWIAEARAGRLRSLEDGRSREQVVDWVIDAARSDPELVAGFDFAFGLPAWYCAQRGWRDGPAAWAGLARADEAEALLAACAPPFWGRPGRPRPHPADRGLRAADRMMPGMKSVFQIGGAGAVGTGSLRGMVLLPRLRAAGFTVWPFDTGEPPAAVEIYPRACYGPRVRKSRRSDRLAFLARHHAEQPSALLRVAASGEDAFDAAVSALAMSAHADGLRAQLSRPGDRLEGAVWTPAAG